MMCVDQAGVGPAPRPLIGRGVVRHARLRPARNAFAYPVVFVLLPMRALAHRPGALALARNRYGLLSFHDRDHGDGGPDSLRWVEQLLDASGVDGVDGEIWLQSFVRVLGYVFNPVSFWYCHRRDGSLAAVVAEVNNTFGERHCYVLRPRASSRGIAGGEELDAAKAFHVSPFCRVEGAYRFRFLRTTGEGRERIVARIDHDDSEGPLLLTSISGRLEALTTSSLARAFAAHPLHGLAVIARIHWQALKLWCKRVPFVSRPTTPIEPVSR